MTSEMRSDATIDRMLDEKTDATSGAIPAEVTGKGIYVILTGTITASGMKEDGAIKDMMVDWVGGGSWLGPGTSTLNRFTRTRIPIFRRWL
ncbi:MAG: hypothetical protein WA632_06935 [Gallionella sp.]